MTISTTTTAAISLAVLLAATMGATEARATKKPEAPGHAKQHHAMMAMHAQHHGSKMNHRMHMAMMKQHGAMSNRKHKAMMSTMQAAHHGGMAGPTARVAMMPAKQPGSCGTYMYWKAGACLDARNKK